MTALRRHWLTDVAIAAGLPGIDSLEIPAGAQVAEAWDAVVAATGVSPEALAGYVAGRFRLAVADLGAADPRAINLLPEELAKTHQVLALREGYRRIVVATSDPTDLAAEQAIQFTSGRSVVFEVAPPTRLKDGILFFYSSEDVPVGFLSEGEGVFDLGESIRLVEDEVDTDTDSDIVLASGPVVRLTNMILHEAARLGASDIHLQPTPHGGLVRLRVDGVLRTVGTMPIPVLSRIVSRIKIMAKLDISDRLRPQDGRARMQLGGKNIDLRVSTVPTRQAEKAVIRLLDPGVTRSLDEIGLPPSELRIFRELLNQRDGIVVVTGPTGSGKTTTMYAALTHVASDGVNVMTVEDPVEFELPGMTQIQVETRQGVTFPSALRAILRQDPDVIFVGEIRDHETAEVAVHAAMTGHLVLATLHTNDAVATLRRLIDLGLDTAAINGSFRGALAQRLLRRPCPNCRIEVTNDLTPSEQKLATRYGVRPRFRTVGCEECGNTGYRGRLPIIQTMVMTPELRKLLTANATPDDLEAAARSGAGMRSLVEIAAERVALGETTLEELDRVLGDEAQGNSPQDEAPPAEEPPSSPSSPSSDPATSKGKLERAEVLVVDDDPMARTLARALLEAQGYRVKEADDGAVADELLSAGLTPDLVILDLLMPTMGGDEFLSRLIARPTTSRTGVIVLTGDTDPDSEVRLMDMGADDYVRKPLDPRLFMSRVRAVLRRVGG